MNTLNEREQLFVALGAAIGSNCVPCVEKIMPKAKAAGIEDWELRLALNAADSVRQKPAAKVLSLARAMVDGDEIDNATCSPEQMGCTSNSKAKSNTGNKWNCCG